MALVSTTERGKDLRGCLVSIRASWANLRQAEQRVAEYVLEHSGEVVHSSVTELAQASGTSEATVVRFCRALGYRGFPEMKLILARDLARQDESVEAGEVLTAADSVEAIARHVFQVNIQALIDTMELQPASDLDRAVTLLAGARRIVLCGVGGSGAIVQAAAHKFQLIGLQAAAHADPNVQRIVICQLDAQDVVIGVSNSGSAGAIVQALELAARVHASTICITNQAGSPLARVAGLTLLTAGAEITVAGHPVASRLAEIALMDVLFVAIALRRAEDSARALEQVAQAKRTI